MEFRVGFSHNEKIGSKLLAESEKRPYSHAYIVYTDTITQFEMVYQESHGMAHLIKHDKFKAANTVVKEYPIAMNNGQQFQCYIYNAIGTPYSITELFVLFVAKIFQLKKLPTRIYKAIKNGKSSMICSEAIARLLHDLKYIDFPADTQFDMITPSDLDERLKQVYG